MTPCRRWWHAATLLALLFAASPTPGQPLPPPGDPAWRPLGFPGIDRHTRYDVVEVGGSAAFRARSDCSASGMVLPLEGVDLSRTPRLGWRWKVEQGLEIEDERSKATDDFAARVYVMFRFDPEQASLWERLRRRIGGRLYGVEMPGETLSYVWASGVARGQHWANPYAEEAQMVALRSGEAAGWRREIVDLVADHRRLAGRAPEPLLALAVMSDSDNVCQQATAYFADFRLLAPGQGVPEPTSPPADTGGEDASR